MSQRTGEDHVGVSEPSLERAPKKVSALRVVQATPELLAMIPASPSAFSEFIDSPEFVAAACAPGNGMVLLDGGYVIAAAGFLHMPGGRAEAWAWFGGFTRPRHVAFVRDAARKVFDRLAADPRYRRIEIAIQEGERGHARYAEQLGFRFESTMDAYFEGLTFERWVRLNVHGAKMMRAA